MAPPAGAAGGPAASTSPTPSFPRAPEARPGRGGEGHVPLTGSAGHTGLLRVTVKLVAMAAPGASAARGRGVRPVGGSGREWAERPRHAHAMLAPAQPGPPRLCCQGPRHLVPVASVQCGREPGPPGQG